MLSSVSSFQPQAPVFHATEHSNKQNIEATKSNTSEEQTKAEDGIKPTAIESTNKVPGELSKNEQALIIELKNRDIEVKAHEQAHKSAAGAFATGGPSFTYTTGPNGQRYATGGEVGIDISAVAGDPAATIQKAETIRRAALAPASPSGQDRAVASKASALLHQAISDLAEETKVNLSEKNQSTEENQATEETSETDKTNATESGSTAGSLLDIAV